MAKILVMEDDFQVQETLRLMLERSGHQVECAINGSDGLVKFYNNCPELVITDILMPEKEGLEVIRELRQNQPEMPIIAISGGGISMGPELCLRIARQMGAHVILMKPFTLQELNNAIAKALASGQECRT